MGHAAYMIGTRLPKTPEVSPDRNEPIFCENCPAFVDDRLCDDVEDDCRVTRRVAPPQMSALTAPRRSLPRWTGFAPQVVVSSACSWAHGAGQRADGSSCARETFSTAPDSLAGPPAWLCTVVATS